MKPSVPAILYSLVSVLPYNFETLCGYNFIVLPVCEVWPAPQINAKYTKYKYLNIG